MLKVAKAKNLVRNFKVSAQLSFKKPDLAKTANLRPDLQKREH